jgi:hypothetical protein
MPAAIAITSGARKRTFPKNSAVPRGPFPYDIDNHLRCVRFGLFVGVS